MSNNGKIVITAVTCLAIGAAAATYLPFGQVKSGAEAAELDAG